MREYRNRRDNLGPQPRCFVPALRNTRPDSQRRTTLVRHRPIGEPPACSRTGLLFRCPSNHARARGPGFRVMKNRRFTASKPGVEGYPPCVRGWFCLARSGRMRRGFRDVGYLLARRLGRCRPPWLSRRAWRFHRRTLRECLAAQDDQVAMRWLTATYPGLVALIPADGRREFFAGMGEPVCVDRSTDPARATETPRHRATG